MQREKAWEKRKQPNNQAFSEVETSIAKNYFLWNTQS
jgi:hypothetical protein